MSCQACNEAQDRGDSYYWRFNYANILLSGCREHIRQLMALLNSVAVLPETRKDEKPKAEA